MFYLTYFICFLQFHHFIFHSYLLLLTYNPSVFTNQFMPLNLISFNIFNPFIHSCIPPKLLIKNSLQTILKPKSIISIDPAQNNPIQTLKPKIRPNPKPSISLNSTNLPPKLIFSSYLLVSYSLQPQVADYLSSLSSQET